MSSNSAQGGGIDWTHIDDREGVGRVYDAETRTNVDQLPKADLDRGA